MSVVLLLAIAWIYVVAMMAIAEATSPVGSLLGACVTFVLYGVLPLGIALYLASTPARRRRRASATATDGTGSATATDPATAPRSAPPVDPDAGGHAAGDAVAPVREEP